MKIRVAVATKGQGLINEHFGHASEFQVYDVSQAGIEFIECRRVDRYCQGGEGEEDALETIIRSIGDCRAVFVARIGNPPSRRLNAAGIEPVDQYPYEFIEKAIQTYFKESVAGTKEVGNCASEEVLK